MSKQKISTCLWFDDQAEEAAKFYTSVFKNSKIGKISRYGDEGAQTTGKPKGSVLTVTFTIEGQEFMALNGGPHFAFSPAISLVVNCKTQKELDEIWNKLSAVKSAEQCGWLKDKFGLSWQIVPEVLEELMGEKNQAQSNKVMAAVLQMKKLDIKAIQQAAGR